MSARRTRSSSFSARRPTIWRSPHPSTRALSANRAAALNHHFMLAYHVHQWQIRREWRDADGRWLRHRTCEDCSLEQQVRYVIEETTWTLFRMPSVRA